jgi:hypothetical protein
MDYQSDDMRAPLSSRRCGIKSQSRQKCLLEHLSNYIVNKGLQFVAVHHNLIFPNQVNTPASQYLWSYDLFMIV